MSVYRAKFGRILALDEAIRSGRYPNCASFAREYEVSAKTVQRDIDFLRYARGAPIEFDPDRNGYRYADPAWRLAPIELSESEMLQLAVAERMAAQYAGTPIAANLDQLFAKLHAVLPETIRVDPIDVRARFSFHGHPVREVSPAAWRAVARAARDGRMLRVAYRRYGAPGPKTHLLEPLHLTSIDGEWALVARIERRDDVLMFALSRMERVTPLRRAARRRDFDAAAFFENRFARFIGEPGATHEVAIRFTAHAAPGVLERRWHPRQTVETRKDGSIVLTFPAPSLYEVQRWTLQWGGDAEVLRPRDLRAAVAKEAVRLAKMYG